MHLVQDKIVEMLLTRVPSSVKKYARLSPSMKVIAIDNDTETLELQSLKLLQQYINAQAGVVSDSILESEHYTRDYNSNPTVTFNDTETEIEVYYPYKKEKHGRR